jgi:hypothetical protein
MLAWTLRSRIVGALVVLVVLAACNDTRPQTATLEGDVYGCADVFVYRLAADGRRVVVVEVDAKKLGLAPGATRTFQLGAKDPSVMVRLDEYPKPVDVWVHCSDIKYPHAPPTELAAASGSLTLTLAPDAATSAGTGTYFASVVLRDARFVRAGGGVVTVPRVVIDHVRVGWLAG